LVLAHPKVRHPSRRLKSGARYESD